MPHPFLFSKRLYYTTIHEKYLDHYLMWINDPDVRRTLGGDLPWNKLHEKKFLQEAAKAADLVLFTMVIQDGDIPIGTVSLLDIQSVNRSATYGILIGEKQYWNKGYGTEATRTMIEYGFGTLNLHRIWLTVYDFNYSGIRAYERAGFKKEAVLREALFREGSYHDVLMMSILKSETEPRPSFTPSPP